VSEPTETLDFDPAPFYHGVRALGGSQGLYLAEEPLCLICGQVIPSKVYRCYHLLQTELQYGLFNGDVSTILTLLESWDIARDLAPQMFATASSIELIWVRPSFDWTGLDLTSNDFIHARCYDESMDQLRSAVAELFNRGL
jgi:hypothetical protein